MSRLVLTPAGELSSRRVSRVSLRKGPVLVSLLVAAALASCSGPYGEEATEIASLALPSPMTVTTPSPTIAPSTTPRPELPTATLPDVTVGLADLAPGMYIMTWSPDGIFDGLAVRSTSGALVARIPQADTSEPDWDSQNQRLAFTRRSNRIGVLEFPYRDVKELDTFPPGTTPSWAPDGARIVYIRYGDTPTELPHELQIVDFAREQTFPIPLRLRRIERPAWSPDGKWIAFAATDSDKWIGPQLFMIDMTCLSAPTSCDGTLRPLTTNTPYVWSQWPSWSPEGTGIAYECSFNLDAADDTNICLFDVASAETSLLVQSAASEFHPVWSPDGEWIAYTAVGSGLDGFQVMLVRRDGSGLRRIPTESDEILAGWLEINPGD